MTAMLKAFPIEFRNDVVAVARKRQAPLSQIAKDFGISESCLHRWLHLADVEDGVRPGLTAAESAEIRELKKRTGCWNRRTRSCAGRRRSLPASRSQNDASMPGVKP
jgi:transposase